MHDEISYKTWLRLDGMIPLFASIQPPEGSDADGETPERWVVTSAETELPTSDGAVIPVTPKRKQIVVIERVKNRLEPTTPSTAKYYRTRTEDEMKDTNAIFMHFTSGGGSTVYSDNPMTWSALNDVGGHVEGEAGDVACHITVAKDGRIVQLYDLERCVHTQGTNYGKDLADKSDHPKSVLARDKAKAGINTANAYGFSIECGSATYSWGRLTMRQLNALHYAIRYIQDYLLNIYDTELPITRLWKEFPDLPKIDPEIFEDHSFPFGDPDGNEIRRVPRYYEQVYGQFLGHNDVTPKGCPGAYFPWRELLRSFGAYPTNWENPDSPGMQLARTEAAKFYALDKEDRGEPPFYKEDWYPLPQIDDFILWEREWEVITRDLDPQGSIRTFLEEERGYAPDSYDLVQFYPSGPEGREYTPKTDDFLLVEPLLASNP